MWFHFRKFNASVSSFFFFKYQTTFTKLTWISVKSGTWGVFTFVYWESNVTDLPWIWDSNVYLGAGFGKWQIRKLITGKENDIFIEEKTFQFREWEVSSLALRKLRQQIWPSVQSKNSFSSCSQVNLWSNVKVAQYWMTFLSLFFYYCNDILSQRE